MTERQFRAWLAWLDMQWDRPSRSDHYVTRLTSVMAGKDVGPLKFQATGPGTEFDLTLVGTPEQEARWETMRMKTPAMLASGELTPPVRRRPSAAAAPPVPELPPRGRRGRK